MSTEEQNFDDLLKSKLNESEFAFNEANWDKAEQLIIRAEEKRKRRRIGFIFFFGMLLGICIMIPFIGDKSSIDKNLRSEKEALAYTNKIETKPKIESSKKVTEADVKPMNKNGGSNSISKSEVDKNSIKEVRKEDGEKTNLIEPGRTKKQKNSLANEVLTQVKEPNTNRKAPQSVRGEDYKSESNMPIIKEKEIIGSNESIKNKKEGIIEKANEIVSINQEKTESQAISVQTSDSANIPVLINSSLKKDTVITIKDSIIKTKIDSSKAIALDTTKAFKKSTIFSIDAGVNYTFGWTNNSTKEAAGVNAIFGISTTHQFSKKWGALLGIQYTSLAHLNYSNFTSNNLQYDFGYNQTKTVITPTILYYVAVPIKLQYNFNEKNGISIGANFLYLLTTNSKVGSYTQGTFGSPNYKTSTKFGYMDGFATWDLQPALAYRRRIIKCLSINAEIYYGLMDIKNNAAFGLAKSEHNNGFKITLSYNLSHK